MSEPFGVSITIGGTIKFTDLEEFCDVIKEDMNEITGPTSPEEFPVIGTVPCNTWYAQANWGDIDSLKAFCKSHNLPYKATCDPQGEYDGEIVYWIPGMKHVEILTMNGNGNSTILVDTIRPYTNMLITLVKGGLEQLPLLIHDEHVGPLVTKMLKSKTPYKVLEKALNSIIPEPVPAIPDLIIV